jgi:large subunit ribosomal protein L29
MKSKVQAKDLRGNETAELERTLAKLREDLFQARLKHSTNQIENTMTIRNTRRDIARVSMVLAEKARNAAVTTTQAAPKAEEK